ncbi:MAG TPA: hypothetical protein VL475_09550 [Planctomycetaceae bacterium]|nr:hypothetical protein [Planctomycetaceae bacterium]
MSRNRATAGFINDGYTRTGRIDGSAFHSSVLFEYRPMLPQDRAVLVRRLRQFAPEDEIGIRAAEFVVVRELSRRLISWTLLDRSGNPLPITGPTVRAIEPHLLAGIANIILGFQPGDDERHADDERNLIRGTRLLLVAPHLAARDCGDCQLHVYDETTGRRAQHGGHPVPRPAGTAPPCRLPHVGCLKGTPENPNSLSTNNQFAYRFHQECRAVGQFPDDSIVRHHAVVIQRVEQSVGRERPPGPVNQRARSAGFRHRA